MTEELTDENEWEYIVIPDLISEREKKLLEERKKVEEGDVELSKDLFNSPLLFREEPQKRLEVSLVNEFQPIMRINWKKKKQEKNQIKEMKIKNKRISEIFGDAKIDEYYDQYGSIEDKY